MGWIGLSLLEQGVDGLEPSRASRTNLLVLVPAPY